MEMEGVDSAEAFSGTTAAAIHESALLPMMAPESGIRETTELDPKDTPMSRCALHQLPLDTQLTSMNGSKELSRSPSGTILEGCPPTKRIKLESTKTEFDHEAAASTKAVSIGGTKTRASPPPLQKASSAISTDAPDASAKLRMVSQSSPGSTSTPQLVSTSSASEGNSSGSSLEFTSRAGSSAPLAKPASTNELPSRPQTGAVAPPSPPPPLKSTTMRHLHQKYTMELEYMLREFRKLERQLLGAKGNGTGVEENAGSRERREKLHSFILHLEDTLRQIELGVQLEAEGKSTVMVGVTLGGQAGNAPTPENVKQNLADSGALTNLTKEKEEEENVQKLEEHILANLLPVKVRLKKQLAAQQGASRNPVGMPVARRGMLPSVAAEKGTGTFAAAAEQRRKQAEAAAAEAAEADSQFGKPLTGGASSLTQKLHGQTLGGHGVGSSARPQGLSGETDEKSPQKRKVFYAGMAPGSKQVQSGILAASGVHKVVVETPGLYKAAEPAKTKEPPKAPETVPSASTKASKPGPVAHHPGATSAARRKPTATLSHGQQKAAREAAALNAAAKKQERATEAVATEEDQRKLKKLRKKKKLKKLAQQMERERQLLHVMRQRQTVPPKVGATATKGRATAGKGPGKKKGPRSVEYICALCSETYNSTCDCNPWWALTSHDCPKCRKTQIPRIDIASPANEIEYHPALLAHAEENAIGAGGGGGASIAPQTSAMHVKPSHIASSNAFPSAGGTANRRFPTVTSDSDSSTLSDISDGDLSDDSYDSDDDLDLESFGILSPAERAENEQFGMEYDGPKLTEDETSRLLVLMSHASTCPGRHKHAKHRDVCNSVKYLMLHVRDCPGTTFSFDICPFPWCRKVKHMLYHLISCMDPKECPVCSPTGLSSNLEGLVGLNNHRRKKQRERRAAAMAAAAAAAKLKKPLVSRAQALANTVKRCPVVPQRVISSAVKRPGTKPVNSATLAARNGPVPAGTTAGKHPGKPTTAPRVPASVVTAAKGAPTTKSPSIGLVHAKDPPKSGAAAKTVSTGVPAKLETTATATSQVQGGTQAHAQLPPNASTIQTKGLSAKPPAPVAIASIVAQATLPSALPGASVMTASTDTGKISALVSSEPKNVMAQPAVAVTAKAAHAPESQRATGTPQSGTAASDESLADKSSMDIAQPGKLPEASSSSVTGTSDLLLKESNDPSEDSTATRSSCATKPTDEATPPNASSDSAAKSKAGTRSGSIEAIPNASSKMEDGVQEAQIAAGDLQGGSSDLARSPSSCSDVVKKNGEMVRISSC